MSMPGFTAQVSLFSSRPYRPVGHAGRRPSATVAAAFDLQGCASDQAAWMCANTCYPDEWHCDGDKCVCHNYGWQPPPPPATTTSTGYTTSQDWYANEALRKARFGY